MATYTISVGLTLALPSTAETGSGRCRRDPFSFSRSDRVEQLDGWTLKAAADPSVPDASAVFWVCLVWGQEAGPAIPGRRPMPANLIYAVTCTYSPQGAQGQGRREEFPATTACFPRVSLTIASS